MQDIFHFPDRIARAPTTAAVCAELVALTAPWGFAVYAIGGQPHPQTPYPTPFMVTNWPPEWRTAYFDRQFGERDPTLRALSGTGRAFSITELREGRLGFLPAPEELEVLDFASQIGCPHGFLVPVFRAHGYAGFACVAGIGPDPAPGVRTRLQFLLEHAHDRLRTLATQQAAPGPVPVLSPREIEVLTLARQGLSDAGIAEAIAISVRTVRFHFENARRKLAARSRSEAIAIAVGRHLLPV